MRGEFVSVVAPVPADVALKGVAEAVAAHVDGEHHIVQKEDAAVVAPVDPDGFPFLVDDLKGVARAYGRGLDYVVGPGEILQGLQAVAGLGRELALMEGGVLPLLVVAVSVCGVLAAVVRGKASVRRQAFVPEVAVALLGVLRGAVGHVGAGQRYGIQAADDGNHLRSGGRRRLHERAQGLGPEVGDGVVYGLVHHASLHYVAFLLIHET